MAQTVFLGPEVGGEAAARRLCAEIIDLGKRELPGAEILCHVRAGREANTRFAQRIVTSTGDVSQAEVRVQVAFGQKVAGYSTNQTDRASLRAALAMAGRLARLSPEDPEHQPLLPPQRYVKAPTAYAYDVPTAKLSAEARAQAVADVLGVAAAELDVSGYYEHSAHGTALASTSGLWAYHQGTYAELSTTARTRDGSGSGWAAAYGHRAAALAPQALAKTAADKARRSRGAQALAPGRYTVVLEPAAVAELLEPLIGAMNARTADEGRSFFSAPRHQDDQPGKTRLGEALFPAGISITSDPAAEATPGRPFDHEGLPLRRTEWVAGGVLKALHCSRFWARKQGREPLGRPSVTTLAPGTATTEELIKGVKRGVLITRFWYTRMVDPQSLLITGLTRDGVFLIEDGVVGPPVNNFRFNESPVTMLRNADLLGKELSRQAQGSYVPALRTHEFNLASVSEAV